MSKQGGVPCLCHRGTQAAQPIAVSVSTWTCWNALTSALGPTALDVKPEELSGKAAAPVQPLHVPFPWVWRQPVHCYALVHGTLLGNVPRLGSIETAISSRA